MTSLAKPMGLRAAAIERPTAPGTARSLLAALEKECERQVPFSQAKVLLREAAAAIEGLQADLASVRAELDAERAARQER